MTFALAFAIVFTTGETQKVLMIVAACHVGALALSTLIERLGARAQEASAAR